MDLNAKLSLDIQQAIDALGKVQDELGQTAREGKRAATEINRVDHVSRSLGSRGVQYIRAFNDWLTRSAAAAAAAAVSIGGALKAAKELGQIGNTREGLMRLGVTNDRIREMNKALGGTVDRLTLMQTLQDAVQKGVPVDQFVALTKTAAVLAKEYGLAKDQALKLVASGELTDAQLEKLGTSSLQIQNRISALEVKRRGNLSEIEKTQEKIRAIIEATRKTTKGFGTDTKQIGDTTAKAFAELKNIGLELGNTILPKITSWLKDAKEAVQDLSLLKTRLIGPDEEKIAKQYTKQLKKNAPVVATLVQAGTKLAATQEKQTKDLVKQNRLRAEARRQYLEMIKALQQQAKDLTDNSYEKMLQVIADQGGAFGGVASAMTDTAEKARIFSTTAFGRRGLVAAGKIAAMYQGQQNVDLMQKIELHKQELGLLDKNGNVRKRALATAKLMAGWLQAGAKDTREYLGNERAANIQLRAGLQLLQGHAKIAQLRVEQNNAMKDVQQSMMSAQAMLNAALAKRADLAKGGAESDKSQIGYLDQQITRLRTTVASYQQISAERQQILKAAQAHAQIELQLEKTLKRQERAIALRSAKDSLDAAGRGLMAARGQDTTAAGMRAAGEQQQQALRDQIAKLKAEADAAIQKLVAGGLNGDSQQQLLEQIQNQERILALKQRELDLVEKTTRAQIQGLTTTGSFMQQMHQQINGYAKQLGTQLAGAVQGFAGGVGSSIASMFEGIVSGSGNAAQELGRNFFNILGDIAMQMGGFFVSAGTAQMFVPPYTGGGAIAGGLALMGLGGALKGAGGLVKAPSASGSAPRSPAFSSPSFRDRLPGTTTDNPKNVRETFIMINGVPWRKDSKAQDFRDAVDWFKQGRRATGLSLEAV